MSVVLPAPFSPSSASTSPRRSVRLTSWLAMTPGNRLVTLWASSTISRSTGAAVTALLLFVDLADRRWWARPADKARQHNDRQHIGQQADELMRDLADPGKPGRQLVLQKLNLGLQTIRK